MNQDPIDLPEQLRRWGAAHAQARAAEQALSCAAGAVPEDLQRDARRLREQADRLHRDIYGRIGRASDHPR